MRVALRQALGRAAASVEPASCVRQTAAWPSGMQRPWPGSSGIDVEGVAVVRVRGGGEAELGRQALGDLRPRLPGVVAAMHADVVLLVHALACRAATSRACARSSRPPGSRAASRRAGRGCAASTSAPSSVVSKMPRPWTIAQKRAASSGCGRIAGMPRWPGRLVRRVVPVLAARLAVERAEERPGRAAVAALEHARQPRRRRARARARPSGPRPSRA